MRDEVRRRNVSEVIGDEYKDWKSGQIIYINATTGAGKTFFILNTLLPYVIASGKRLLYLVNRKVLKAQIETTVKSMDNMGFFDTDEHSVIIEHFFEIRTYQSIEEKFLKGNRKEELDVPIPWLENFDYVVYDECHYFYVDSMFNTNTGFSYDCLTDIFDKKVQIYMSATMEKIKPLINRRRPILRVNSSWGICTPSEFEQLNDICYRSKEYIVEPVYDYLDIIAFENEDEVIGRICNTKSDKSEKWLFFTDSIDRGKSIKRILTSSRENEIFLDEEDVVFIDADYEKDDEQRKEVEGLANNCYIERKVVIATSVMDNGISFHDKDLRNIVIMADNEETFIQMLGRKRIAKEGEPYRTKVFVCKRDKIHFERRIRNLEKRMNIYKKYRERINNAFQIHIKDYKKNERVEVSIPYLYWQCAMAPNYIKYDCQVDFKQSVEQSYLIQGQILHEMLHDEKVYLSIKSFCYVFWGLFAENYFAMARAKNLMKFYQTMVDKLEIDENSFLKEQLRWLKRTEEEAEKIEAYSKSETQDTYRELLRTSLEKLFADGKSEVKWSKAENIEWKMKYNRALIYIAKDMENGKNECKGLGQNERAIAGKKFNMFMELYKLPYRMRVVKAKNAEVEEEKEEGGYVIFKTSDEN